MKQKMFIIGTLICLILLSGCNENNECSVEFKTEQGITYFYEGKISTLGNFTDVICCSVGKHSNDINKDIKNNNVKIFCGTNIKSFVG